MITDSGTFGHALFVVYNLSTESMAAASDSSVRQLAVSSGGEAVRAPSFETIYDSYVDFVWRSLLRLGVPHNNLEDAVQDVFIVVLRRLGDFEGRSTVRTWLFGIAIRVAKDQRRTLQRKGPHDPLEDDLVDLSPDPSARSERAAAFRVLSQLLDELDLDKRAVFVMSEIEQMSAVEMAEVLGENHNTVYSRLRAAREEFERAVVRYRKRQR